MDQVSLMALFKQCIDNFIKSKKNQILSKKYHNKLYTLS